MKRLILLLLFVSQSSFSQTEKDNYELYSLILTEQLKFGSNDSADSVVIIEQFKNQFKKSDYEIFDTEKDSITSSDVNFIYTNSNKDSTFIKRLINEPKLRKVIKEITSDLNTQPTINIKLLSSKNIIFQTITYNKYSSFFGKKRWRKNSWKRIKRKYGTTNIIEFAKINYNENFASTYYEVHCGGLCGGGSIVIFEKANGNWRVIAEISLWMA